MRLMLGWILLTVALLGCAAPTSTPSTPSMTQGEVATEIDGYARLLRETGRTDQAEAVAAQAEQLRLSGQKQQEAYEAYLKGRPYDTSFYLGFDPSKTLREYAGALRAAGRAEDADRIEAMADAWQAEQMANAEALAAQ